MAIEIQTRGFQINRDRYARAPQVLSDLCEKNLRSLGKVIAAKERRVLDVVKYRGTLARSISTYYEAYPPTRYMITIGPAGGDKHAYYVYFGTKPHKAPIEPLKEWARWKLGDENAAFAVQRSIAHHGTSVYIERLGLGDGHGGYKFPERTLLRPDVQQGIARTAARTPLELKMFVDTGEVNLSVTNAGEE